MRPFHVHGCMHAPSNQRMTMVYMTMLVWCGLLSLTLHWVSCEKSNNWPQVNHDATQSRLSDFSTTHADWFFNSTPLLNDMNFLSGEFMFDSTHGGRILALFGSYSEKSTTHSKTSFSPLQPFQLIQISLENGQVSECLVSPPISRMFEEFTNTKLLGTQILDPKGNVFVMRKNVSAPYPELSVSLLKLSPSSGMAPKSPFTLQQYSMGKTFSNYGGMVYSRNYNYLLYHTEDRLIALDASYLYNKWAIGFSGSTLEQKISNILLVENEEGSEEDMVYFANQFAIRKVMLLNAHLEYELEIFTVNQFGYSIESISYLGIPNWLVSVFRERLNSTTLALVNMQMGVMSQTSLDGLNGGSCSAPIGKMVKTSTKVASYNIFITLSCTKSGNSHSNAGSVLFIFESSTTSPYDLKLRKRLETPANIPYDYVGAISKTLDLIAIMQGGNYLVLDWINGKAVNKVPTRMLNTNSACNRFPATNGKIYSCCFNGQPWKLSCEAMQVMDGAEMKKPMTDESFLMTLNDDENEEDEY